MTAESKSYVTRLLAVGCGLLLACSLFLLKAWQADVSREELLDRKEAEAIQHCVRMGGHVQMRYNRLDAKFALIGCDVPPPPSVELSR